MPDKKPNENGSARFMPTADEPDTDASQEPNLLSDEPETASILTEDNGESTTVEAEPVETADGGGMNLSKQKSGAGKWLVIVLLVLALGGLGYWYWYKTSSLNKQVSEKASLVSSLESDKTKLTADLKTAQENATTSGDEEYEITELKVKFKPSSSLTGLVYAYDQKGKVAAFTTRDLSYKFESSIEAGDKYKLNGGLLGLVYVLEDSGVNEETCKVTIKKFGSRTVCYTSPQQVGTNDEKVRSEIEKAASKLQSDLKASIHSIE